MTFDKRRQVLSCNEECGKDFEINRSPSSSYNRRIQRKRLSSRNIAVTSAAYRSSKFHVQCRILNRNERIVSMMSFDEFFFLSRTFLI